MGQTLDTGLIINGLTGDTNVLQVNGNSFINGDVNITGNVNVIGTATTLNTETVQTRDNRILLNYSGTTLSAINGGIEVLSGKTNGENISLTTNVNGDWNSNTGLNITGRTSNSTTNGLSVFNSSGTNILKVRNDGNVGINTSNPNYQLEVLPKDLTGTTQVVIRNTSTSPNWQPVGLYVQDGSGYGVSMSNSTNGVDTALTINSGLYSYLNHAVNGTTVAELLTAGNSLLWRLPDSFQFRRRATNNAWAYFDSLNQRVSIGNENIGTPTIPARLGLRGDTNTSSSYSLVIQNSGGTNTFVARDDGNVGIGISNPTVKLHLSGDSTFEQSKLTINQKNSIVGIDIVNSTEPMYQLTRNVNDWALVGKGSNSFYFYSNDGKPTTFYVNGSERMRITSGTTFGVGTNNPTATIHAKGIDSTDSNYGLKVQNSGGTDNLVVRNDGNVGIGTSSPTRVLDSRGTFNLQPSTNTFLRFDGTAIEMQVGSTNNSLVINRDNQGISQLKGSGEVSITNVSDLNSITLGDSMSIKENYGISFSRSDNNTYGLWDSTNYRLKIGNLGLNQQLSSITSTLHVLGSDNTSSNYGLKVDNYTGGTNLVVRNDGNVGIGTSTPSEKLEVSGKTKTTNFQMTSGATEDYIMTSDSQGNGRWTPSYNLSTKDYGSFYDTTTQTGGTGTIQSFQLNSTGTTKGVSITNLTGVTVTHTGVYNIQFSAQIQSTVGTPENVFIWLRKNGLDIPYTNTGIEIGNNNDYFVAAWNFVETLNANDTINLMWYCPSSNITILHNDSPTAGPAIPSLILTINQI